MDWWQTLQPRISRVFRQRSTRMMHLEATWFHIFWCWFNQVIFCSHLQSTVLLLASMWRIDGPCLDHTDVQMDVTIALWGSLAHWVPVRSCSLGYHFSIWELRCYMYLLLLLCLSLCTQELPSNSFFLLYISSPYLNLIFQGSAGCCFSWN